MLFRSNRSSGSILKRMRVSQIRVALRGHRTRPCIPNLRRQGRLHPVPEGFWERVGGPSEEREHDPAKTLLMLVGRQLGLVEAQHEAGVRDEVGQANAPVPGSCSHERAFARGVPIGKLAADWVSVVGPRLAAESAPLPEPWPAEARQALVRMLASGRGLLGTWETLEIGRAHV